MTIAPIRSEMPERRLSVVTTGPIPVTPTALPGVAVVPDQLHQREMPVPTPSAPADGEDTGTAHGRGTAARALAIAVGVALTFVIVAPIVLSSQHLIDWAHSDHGLGLSMKSAWLAFLALDMAAAACIGMTTYCAMRGESAGAYGVLVWAFAFGSAYSNHSGASAEAATHHRALDGVWFFPAMSLTGPLLLEVTLARVRRWARIAKEEQMSARPKFGVRWLPGIAFRETLRAWTAARREGITKAPDAVAFVREAAALAEMNDADAVAYAKSALRTDDAYKLRRWLTKRGRTVAQTALTPVTFTRPIVPAWAATPRTPAGDIERDGAPMAEILAPMPDGVRADRRALDLPPAPEPPKAIERPAAKPKPEQATARVTEMPRRRPKGDPTGHPKWAEGVAAYRQSIADGNPLSQYKLADRLGMKNRVLAAKIMAHVATEMGREG